jgi:hypothetical protein
VSAYFSATLGFAPKSRHVGGINRIAYNVSILILALGFAGCAGSTRTTAIHTALITANAANAGFIAYDGPHELAIVNASTSREQAESQLAQYRAKRAEVEKALIVLFQAIAVASTLDDSQSLAAVVSAGTHLQALVAALEGGAK